MKESVLVAVCFASSAAWGQSGVTLYGVADTNLEYVTHLGSQVPTAANGFNAGAGNNVFRMSSGGLSGSRWGLRGVEDLGNGFSTLFVLESGFAIDSGVQQQGGRLFGRQAFLGLDSGAYGKVTFGRQYHSLFDALASFSPTGFATQYEPVVLQVGVNFRSDNTVKYTGNLGPVTATAHWSFGNGVAGGGEVPGDFRRDSGYGAGLTYGGQAFGATVAYDQYNPTLSGGTGSVKKFAVAASYAVGLAKIMGGYRWGRSVAADGQTMVFRDDYYWVGANCQVLPAFGLTLQYNYDNVRNLVGNTNRANPWQVSFVADYNLSKRTDLYLTTAFAKNAGLNFDTSAIGFANAYFLGTGESTMLGVALGIRHKF